MYPVVGITQVEGEKPAVSLAVPAAFFHHGVDGVSYDIVDCLLQVYGICQGDDRVIRKVAADFYMAGLLFKGLQDAFQQFFQINIYQMQLVGFRTFMDFINPAVKLSQRCMVSWTDCSGHSMAGSSSSSDCMARSSFFM